MKKFLVPVVFVLIFLAFVKSANASCNDFIVENPTIGDSSSITIRLNGCTFDTNRYAVAIVNQAGNVDNFSPSWLPTQAGGNSFGWVTIPIASLSGSGNFLAQLIDINNPGSALSQEVFVASGSASEPGGNESPGAGNGSGGTATNAGGTAEQVSEACGSTDYISTAIGCIPINDITSLTSFVLGWSLGIAGGVALLMIGFASFRIATSQGNPQRLQGGQELLLSAIGGLLMVVLSVFLLRFVGVDLLGLFAN